MTEEEFLPLFDQYHNMVYRIALVSTRSQQDAEDIVQTVFLKLLEGKTRPMPGHERAWLTTVTVNTTKNLLNILLGRRFLCIIIAQALFIFCLSGFKFIPNTPNGFEFPFIRNTFKLLSQAFDMYIYRS